MDRQIDPRIARLDQDLRGPPPQTTAAPPPPVAPSIVPAPIDPRTVPGFNMSERLEKILLKSHFHHATNTIIN